MRRLAAALVAGALIGTMLIPTVAAAAESDDDFSYITSVNAGERFRLIRRHGTHGPTASLTGRDVLGGPAFSPNGSRIAFSALLGDETTGRYGLFIVDRDGTGQRRLTNPTYADFDPVWSPNGKWIAFSRDRKGNLNPTTCCVIRRVRPNGTGDKKIPGSRGGINPDWSPDGDRIVYEKPNGIFVSDRDGSNKFSLTGPGGADPAWSPDGNKIAYVRPNGSKWELVVRPSSGGDAKVRVSVNNRLESPAWDLDSKTIYYVKLKGEGFEGRTNSAVWASRPGLGKDKLFKRPNEIIHLAHFDRPGERCDFDHDGNGDIAAGVPGDEEAGPSGSGAVNVIMGTGGGLRVADNQLWHREIKGVKLKAHPGDRLGAAVACGDFDADGRSDLAMGLPGGSGNTGAVNVLYGSRNGLATKGDQAWLLNTTGVAGEGAKDDQFGAALATGDFDGDGYDDLATGVPGKNGGRGMVSVLYGGPDGLHADGSQLLRQNQSSVPGTGHDGDGFGAALAAGDFDRDGIDDLAVGVPGDRVAGQDGAGAVNVFNGSKTGLTTAGSRRFAQGLDSIKGTPQSGDAYGTALAVADWNGDGYADLGAGIPGQNISGSGNAGAVSVIYGDKSGLAGAGNQVWHQDVQDVKGTAATGDVLGTSLDAGDFDGDGFDDLVAGAPGDAGDAGLVTVLYGTSSGLSADRDQAWQQDSNGIPGEGSSGDGFGRAVTVGDFDGDGFDDVAIGVPGKDLVSNANGEVTVIYGSGSRLTSTGSQLWNQDRSGVLGSPGPGDRFGAAVR